MADVIEQPFASKVKETNAPTLSTWRSPESAQWEKADEAFGSDLWSVLSTPTSRRRSVARDFAAAMGAKDEVAEVWVTKVEDDLAVAIALNEADFEIEARSAFLDLVCERLDAGEGNLFVFPNGQVPDWVTRGKKLA